MAERLCECGRGIFSRPFDSTKFPDKCPSCERIENNKALLRQVVQSRSKVAKKGFKKAVKKRGKTERQKAMDRADMWFSRYIRLKHSVLISGQIVCTCYTCNTMHTIKDIENGHWQRRGYKITRFDENNARPQCKKCNYFHSGVPEVFEKNLIRDLGSETVNKLKELSQLTGPDSTIFYLEQAEIFRLKFNEIIKERNIKNPWS